MRKRLVPLVAALALATLLAPGLVTPAAADGGWIGGAAFRIGGVFLSIGFNTVGSHRAGYYYRTRYRLHERDYHCGAACYVDGGVYYHSESCPVVLHYLRRHDVEPYGLFVRFGPRYPRYPRYEAPYYGERFGLEIHRYAPPPPRSDRRHDARRHGYRSYGEYRRYGRYDRDPRGRYYDPRRDHRWRDDRDRGRRDDRDRDRRRDRHDRRDHRDRSRRHGG